MVGGRKIIIWDGPHLSKNKLGIIFIHRICGISLPKHENSALFSHNERNVGRSCKCATAFIVQKKSGREISDKLKGFGKKMVNK